MEFIPLDRIKTNNKYLRLDSDVEELKKSIETVGLINPLILNQEDKLVAGGRRFTALKALGKTEAPFVRIEKSELEQELVSIDENLVRKDLNKMELEASLSRGRELYEKLYPSAKKFATEDLTNPSEQEINRELPNDQRSFIDLTAEKTGLSKKVIKSAIEREERASDKVKSLRSHGELNASQTNELVKLEKEDQEQIADLIPGKTAKEIRDIVKQVRANGVGRTIDAVMTQKAMPNEYKSLQTLITRTNKTLGKILFEDIRLSEEIGEERGRILESISTLRISLDQLLDQFSKKPEVNEETEDVEIIEVANPRSNMDNELTEIQPEI